MAPPSRVRQELIIQLGKMLTNYIDSHHGDCEVYPAPFSVNLDVDDENQVGSDISVICDKTKLADKGCRGTPDSVIEITSLSSRKMDYSTKNALYLNTGVREYWVVDTEKERTTVYRYEENAAPVTYLFNQEIVIGIYSDLTITIADLLD